MTINKVILIGNLTRDPELKITTSGKNVCNIGLATTNHDGTSEFHKIVCFDKLAEITGKYLFKGKKIYLEGRLATRQYGDKTTGEIKYSTEIIASDIQFLSPRRETNTTETKPSQEPRGKSNLEDYSDDIPF